MPVEAAAHVCGGLRQVPSGGPRADECVGGARVAMRSKSGWAAAAPTGHGHDESAELTPRDEGRAAAYGLVIDSGSPFGEEPSATPRLSSAGASRYAAA